VGPGRRSPRAGRRRCGARGQLAAGRRWGSAPAAVLEIIKFGTTGQVVGFIAEAIQVRFIYTNGVAVLACSHVSLLCNTNWFVAARGAGHRREARGLLGARAAARLLPLVERAGRRRPPREPWSAWAAAEEHGSQPSEPAVVIFSFFFLVFKCMWDCIACIYLVIDSLNDLWDLWILHQSIHILSLILRMIWHY